MAGRPYCPDCDGDFFERNGRCAQCHGTGINTQLDSAQPKCPYCHGTGVCATCGGTGRIGESGDTIQRLFS
jgi:DnaJ-class molecular chaperone